MLMDEPVAYDVPLPSASEFQLLNSKPWFVYSLAPGSNVEVLFCATKKGFIPEPPLALKIIAELPAGIAANLTMTTPDPPAPPL